MKGILNILLIATAILFFGCNRTTDEMPTIPAGFDIDIEEDGVMDYGIEYVAVDIDGGDATFGYRGRFIANRNNQILENIEDRALFLRDKDDVRELVEDPLQWAREGKAVDFISIDNNSDGEWPNRWELLNDSDHSTYFFGLKMVNGNGITVGWVEIDINTKNGEVEVVDKGTL